MKYRVFYTVTIDGYLDIEADSPSQARRDFMEGVADDELAYKGEREDLKINDVQDPETGGSYSYDPNEED